MGMRSAQRAEAKAISASTRDATRSYGRGARVLSIGIATTGLVTFAYFSLASHALSEVDYKGISLLWSVMFLIISIIYRPVEQLLSRTISSRRARGFARGWLAGHFRFGLYGGLVLLESCSRCLFALAVVIGVLSGQGAVALGIAAAPLVSLMVVPWALRGRDPAPPSDAASGGELGSSTRFAGAVLVIMAAEQALLNGPVVAADITSTDAALAGFVFNVLLITRAPLQLFQAIQTSLLPHLSGLAVTDSGEDFRHALRVTVLAIWGFAGLVVVGLAAIGPWAMGLLFGGDFDYARGGLVLVGLGMGFHLTAGAGHPAPPGRARGGLAPPPPARPRGPVV